MRLGELTSDLSEPYSDAIVTGFALDHRKIAKGNVFGAFKGESFNAEILIGDAVAAGAVAIVARPGLCVHGAAYIADNEPRRAFADMAARFYSPAPKFVAAVTGTNGKTSVAELTRQLWQNANLSAASIGTLGITTAQSQSNTGMTSPDVVTFMQTMQMLAKQGVSHVIYEASSHGLDQYRSEGIQVQIAGFTNFSRDHLDYHGSMEAYLAAKLRLITDMVAESGAAALWADGSDAAAQVSDAAHKRGLRLLDVGPVGAYVQLIKQTPTPLGQTLECRFDGRIININLPLIGAYQAANALVSAAMAHGAGMAMEDALAGLENLVPVRGRLELAATNKKGAPIYVDYAHTPDAIRAAGEALRPHVQGRLITVFGAGGDRDAGKRPQMAAQAELVSDVVIVTDDNPRFEDAATIRAEILAGATDATEVADRREAILRAIGLAETGDVVLIAGKGHEQGQQIGHNVIPFDDVSVAKELAA